MTVFAFFILFVALVIAATIGYAQGVKDGYKNGFADVEEVKHAHWIVNKEIYCDPYYTCSNCKEDFTSVEDMNYCSWCGAKMDRG